MMDVRLPQHLCLTLHCLREGGHAPGIHPELSVDVQELGVLLKELKTLGYSFCLPHQVSEHMGRTCSVTFDDGYFNNFLFLKLAEEFNIPFILFVASYNIINKTPFIWDIMKSLNISDWGFAQKNYLDIYQSLKLESYEHLLVDSHRPMGVEELKKFENHSLVYLGLHTHTHQPLTEKWLSQLDFQLDENIKFLTQFKKALLKDIALPNGLYSRQTLRQLLKRCERIYTIQGGVYSANQPIIPRISLINPDIGGDLMTQIIKSYSLKRRILRKLVTFRYA